MRILGPNSELLALNGTLQFDDDQPGDTTMRIKGVRIRDFRSIEVMDIDLATRWLNVVGPNEIGKSNVLRGLKATLLGIGVSPDAIRDGATDSEILVDTDDPRLHTIRQRITQSGGKLTITTSEGDDVKRPREKLKELFGLSCFDPLAFYQAKGADQRRMVLEAMPVTVTDEDVAKWTGEDVGAHGLDLTRNGLDVLAHLHRKYYESRAAANKDAENTAAALKLARDESERLHALDKLPKGEVVPPEGQEEAPVRAAEKAREALEQRKQQAETMAKRTEGTRARVAELRAQAAKVHQDSRPPVPPDVLKSAEAEWRAAGEEVTRLQDLLAEAERKHRRLAERMNDLATQRESNEKSAAEVTRLCQQARDLEATLAETAIAPPTADELAQADAAIIAARAHLELVRSARAAHDATVKVCALVDEDDAAKTEAARLDRIVKTLAADAPVELAARANLIPGLTLTEDGVLYQGRPIDDSMSGAQRMLVAVQIAKRANAKAGLLLVDEIGILDNEHMREFVKLCTDGEWQLISTCMRNITGPDGKPVREMVLEAIELDQAA